MGARFLIDISDTLSTLIYSYRNHAILDNKMHLHF